MKEVIILFGEMGSGKNYWGEQLAEEYGYQFLDGDTILSPTMVERVKNFQPLTPKMIEDFVCDLGDAVDDRLDYQDVGGMVLAQALYTNKDRCFLRDYLTKFGYDVKLCWVKVPFWQNAKQLFSRKRGLRWIMYWLMNKPWFETPDHEYYLIED
jgi:gluconate kinase